MTISEPTRADVGLPGAPPDASSPPARSLQCLEVFGGNTPVETGVVMRGMDAWLLSRPWKDAAAGGDVHYLSSCATGRIARVLIADVAGHGERVAGLSQRLRDLMRRHINIVDQRRVMGALNRQFTRDSTDGRFATAAMVTLWTPTGEADLSRAGHPPPLLYRARTGRWSPMPGGERTSEPDDIPLGIEARAKYGRVRVALEAGDMILLYTDAAVEAGVERGRPLGEQGLLEVLSTLDPTKPGRLLADLERGVADRAGGPPGDDLTCVLLRANEDRPRPGLGLGLAAGARIARETVRSLSGKGPIPWPEISARNLVGAFVEGANGARPPAGGPRESEEPRQP
ncbi:MAG: serine/threonine-protein phosphatase [Phycisphaerales bacterium]|nr:serine/threonine-protein phosphatase [Phycisphaerales bacterium]